MLMRKLLLVVCLHIFLFSNAQQLTVEKIMQDTKWIGTSPSSVFWSYDSKIVLFKWNPDKAMADSNYAYSLHAKEPVKWNYSASQKAQAIHFGTYNTGRTQLVYELKGDIYLLDIATNTIKRITQTEEEENNPLFAHNNEWVVYQKGNDLFAWDSKDGITKQ